MRLTCWPNSKCGTMQVFTDAEILGAAVLVDVSTARRDEDKHRCRLVPDRWQNSARQTALTRIFGHPQRQPMFGKLAASGKMITSVLLDLIGSKWSTFAPQRRRVGGLRCWMRKYRPANSVRDNESLVAIGSGSTKNPSSALERFDSRPSISTSC